MKFAPAVIAIEYGEGVQECISRGGGKRSLKT